MITLFGNVVRLCGIYRRWSLGNHHRRTSRVLELEFKIAEVLCQWYNLTESLINLVYKFFNGPTNISDSIPCIHCQIKFQTLEAYTEFSSSTSRHQIKAVVWPETNKLRISLKFSTINVLDHFEALHVYVRIRQIPRFDV